jgi:tripartite-type tricarboxylate transporter receptor subunit TctC
VAKALADPDVRDRLNQQGVTPRGSSADELGVLTKAQFEKYSRLIKEAGIKAD